MEEERCDLCGDVGEVRSVGGTEKRLCVSCLVERVGRSIVCDNCDGDIVLNHGIVDVGNGERGVGYECLKCGNKFTLDGGD